MRTLLVFSILGFVCTARAQTTNSWIKPGSGDWQDASAWSLESLPAPGQTIMLTNQGWKAIAIGPATSQNFPESLNVAAVILGGNTDSFNLLLLNYAGYETPLLAGSVNAGTNSGITALASVLTVSSNSGPGDLSIFSAFNQGAQAIVNAHSITLGNVTNPAAGFGIYNQTNGDINADAISAWSGSIFNQFKGTTTIAGSLSLGGRDGNNLAHYSIGGGSLTAGTIELQRGDFNQTGGLVTVTNRSVTSSLGIAAATYTLSAGILQLQGITIPRANFGPQNPFPNGLSANATLLQTGGTNFCNGVLTAYHEYGAPGIPLAFFGPGRYVLSNGVLCVSSTVRAWLGDFQQWGGWHTNAGTEVAGDIFPNWDIRTGRFTLGGGTLITPSISVKLGDFTQSGGTNQVSGDVRVGTGTPATFTLSGGLLTDQNATVESNPAVPGPEPALFTQTGGTHIVTNLLWIFGPPNNFGSQYQFTTSTYVLSGGVLNAPNIEMVTNAFFNHNGGTLTTSGLLTLGYATWNENTTGQQFGQLLLSAPAGTNATFSLPSGNNCIVRFANSSSVGWSNQVNLLIANWNGSPNGGGRHQVFFGSNASGLTAQQLCQIQFVNPAGSSGTFPAAILATGEIVPARMLASQRTANGLTISWTTGTLQSAPNVLGPYQDVPGATSPYSVQFNSPARFFRLRF